MWTSATSKTTATATATAGITAAAAATATAVVWYNHNSSTCLEESKDNDESTLNSNPIIEVDFMDKLARKSYLNPSTTTTSSSSSSSSSHMRPRGVPETLRILTIDLPHVRRHLVGSPSHHNNNSTICQLAYDRVYADGVAPPKRLYGVSSPSQQQPNKQQPNKQQQSNKQQQQLVEQKAWVKSMVKCMSNNHSNTNNNNNNNVVGIEILEASFQDLNPYNVRKTRQLGSYHYDPGKYTHTESTLATPATAPTPTPAAATTTTTSETHPEHADEVHAPWNQYAWMEELQFRIHGWVPFGAPMEPSSRWSRTLYGAVFQRSIPSQRHWWEIILPPFLQRDPAGMDTGGSSHNNIIHNNNNNNTNWASQKPHVVIANGAAIQRVPSGLRFLQQTCRDAQVPLFVLYDPRVWGANTHETLEQALRDVRTVVKGNIIATALQQQSGFARGRVVGRIEQQAYNNLSLLEKRKSTSTARTFKRRHQHHHHHSQGEEEEQQSMKSSWDTLNAAALEMKLMERGVVTLAADHDNSSSKSNDNDGSSSIPRRHYTPAMVELARQCVQEQQQQQQQQRDSGDAADGQKE